MHVRACVCVCTYVCMCVRMCACVCMCVLEQGVTFPLLSSPPSSTNLTELAKAVRLLASLSPSTPTGDELLKAARALAAATAGLLNSAQPENMEVSTHQQSLLIVRCVEV